MSSDGGDEGVRLKPIAVPAFNPGPMTGEGNTTWLIPGHVPTLIDAGTGEPQHLDALEHALKGARLTCLDVAALSRLAGFDGPNLAAQRIPGL